MTKSQVRQDLRDAWSFACRMIQSGAWRSGLRKSALEAVFEIGDGTGRVWRSWRSGSRVPNANKRKNTLMLAEQRGWLTPAERQLIDIASLPETYLLKLSPPTNIDPPEPVSPLAVRSPRIAAAILLRDAQDRRIRALKIRKLAKRVTGNISATYQDISDERSLQVAEWTKGVRLVEKLLLKHPDGVVLVMLENAYRKKFNETKSGQ
jgi:hypothetical protein